MSATATSCPTFLGTFHSRPSTSAQRIHLLLPSPARSSSTRATVSASAPGPSAPHRARKTSRTHPTTSAAHCSRNVSRASRTVATSLIWATTRATRRASAADGVTRMTSRPCVSTRLATADAAAAEHPTASETWSITSRNECCSSFHKMTA